MKRRGFTLVEILIVVIILGILAAIVIPQFTNASNDARSSSVQSTLQTIRSQLQLFKLQHSDTPPTVTALTGWQIMLTTSTTTESTVTNPAGTNFGPYMQTAPVNPMNGKSTVAAAAASGVGWVYVLSGTNYTIQATDTAMTVALTF